MKKIELIKKVNKLKKECGPLRVSLLCVNTCYIADWLGDPKDENTCKCRFECKITVGYKGRFYVVTRKELVKLIEEVENQKDT